MFLLSWISWGRGGGQIKFSLIIFSWNQPVLSIETEDYCLISRRESKYIYIKENILHGTKNIITKWMECLSHQNKDEVEKLGWSGKVRIKSKHFKHCTSYTRVSGISMSSSSPFWSSPSLCRVSTSCVSCCWSISTRFVSSVTVISGISSVSVSW